MRAQPADVPLSEEEEEGEVLEVSFKHQFEKPGPSDAAADPTALAPGELPTCMPLSFPSRHKHMPAMIKYLLAKENSFAVT